MRNLLIIGLLAFVFATPLGVRAQTATPVTNAQLLEMIQSLMQQVLVLMEKLKEIEATQTASSQTLTAIQTAVVQPVVVGAVSPSLSSSLGTPYCDNGEPTLPVNLSGRWEYGQVRIQPSVANVIGGAAFNNRKSSPYTFGVRDNWGTTTVVVSLSKTQFQFPNHEIPAEYNEVHTIYLGTICQ